jgi:hypothetical protein
VNSPIGVDITTESDLFVSRSILTFTENGPAESTDATQSIQRKKNFLEMTIFDFAIAFLVKKIDFSCCQF